MFDRRSADDPCSAPGGLEAELRAALHERSAGVTTATLLRPEPPAQQVFSSRRTVPRLRIAGAVAAVSVVILAVVIGRAVVAPQQTQTGAPADSTFGPWIDSDSARLTDRIWAATAIENRDTGKSISVGFPLWNGSSGSLRTTVEFRPNGTIVFASTRSHITGSYSIGGGAGARTVTVDGAVPSEGSTNAQEKEAVSLNPNSLLLGGMPGTLELEADLVGDELTLSRGNTAIRFRAAGVTAAAAAVVGSVGYPILRAVSGSWRPSEVRVGGHASSVPVASGATLALTSAGTFEIHSGWSTTLGRWWATPTGIVTADPMETGMTNVSTGTTQQWDFNGMPSAQSETPVPVQKVLADLAAGDVTVGFSDGGALIVTDKGVPGSSVTFVRG